MFYSEKTPCFLNLLHVVVVDLAIEPTIASSVYMDMEISEYLIYHLQISCKSTIFIRWIIVNSWPEPKNLKPNKYYHLLLYCIQDRLRLFDLIDKFSQLGEMFTEVVFHIWKPCLHYSFKCRFPWFSDILLHCFKNRP